MNREDIGKLLGGYATGNLTPDEEQALYAAALEDQELFDALAREQSLRDLLRDPATTAEVLAALDEPKPGWFARWWRPAALAAVPVAAALVVFLVVPPRPQPTHVAVVREQPPALPDRPAAPPPSPAPTISRPVNRPVNKDLSALRSSSEEKLETRAKEEPAGVAGGVVGGVPGGIPSGAPGGVAPQPMLAPAPPTAAVPPPPSAPKMPATQEAQEIRTLPNNPALFRAMTAADRNARELFQLNLASNQMFAKDSATAEQKTQTAPSEPQKSGLPPPSAARGFAGTRAAPAARVAAGPVGVRYTILHAADSRSIRVEPNAAGRIAIWARPAGQAWRIVQSVSVTPLMPVIAKLVEGETEVALWFSRSPGVRAPEEPPAGAAPRVLMEGPRAGDDATYAAVSDPSVNEIRFNITLN